MGLLDSIKGLTRGRKPQIKGGIDKGSDVIGSKVGDQHAAKVDQAAKMGKDAVDKLPD